MRLPPNRDDLFQHPSSDESKINVVQVPLDACIVGEDLPTLVDKLKFEKALGADSTYAPWLDLFPTLDDFEGMPRFWDRTRLEFVSQFDGDQLKARMDIDRQRIDQCDDPWALACVDSRSNFLPGETYSMTPLLDMFNHDPSCTTTARVDGDSRLMLEVDSESVLGISTFLTSGDTADDKEDWKDQLFGLFKGGGATKPSYQPGREVLVSYGSFDNIETLCNYGFVSVNNSCNLEQFKVRSLGMGGPAILIVNDQGSIDNLFNTMSLNALRMSLAVPEELESFKGSGTISNRNEVEMYALVAGELEEAVYDAKRGVAEAKAKNDKLVTAYLEGRRRTLQRGLDGLKAQYPELF